MYVHHVCRLQVTRPDVFSCADTMYTVTAVSGAHTHTHTHSLYNDDCNGSID